ncbi:phospho-2-dehydro-3-deoxyheptonate aldolase [Mycena galericulata]|nr:phospho-2-dehydro-3-deoxyheptonate aldolase [Mycena galericulata]
MSTPPPEWSPSSWRSKAIAQDVEYPDPAHLQKVLTKLETLPPLVTPSEVPTLCLLYFALLYWLTNERTHAIDRAPPPPTRARAAQRGVPPPRRRLRREPFDACTHGARLPVVRIGRIAGQYAKPRSSKTELIGGREVLSFRGDNVNGLDPADRTPDPERLLSPQPHPRPPRLRLRLPPSSEGVEFGACKECGG